MTDPTPSPDDALDELLSAVLDGEADEHERARVEADPELERRLDDLRAVRDLVAEPVAPLDEVTARRLRDRAMAEATPSLGIGATVSAAAGSATSRRPSWVEPRLLGAVAAMLVLVALAVPLARSLGDRGGDDGADQVASTPMADEESTSADAGEAGASNMESMDDAGGADEDGEDGEAWAIGSDPPTGPIDLGDAESDDALADRLDAAIANAVSTERGEEDERPTVTHDEDPPDAVCAPDSAGTLVATYTGRVDGDDRIVQLFDDDLGAARVVVLDAATCEVLLRRP